ncbi:MAG: peptide chain release factor N(5)-glutamine methyltransferase [Hyphomicrobiales bacterium]
MNDRLPATAGSWLRAASDTLKAEGIETPALDARRLLLDGLKIPHSVIIADPELALNDDELAALQSMIERRLNREPVSRILGVKEFWGRPFRIGPEVLDPRPDTETLIEAVLDASGEEEQRILDIGAGSGCIAITLLAERPSWHGVATDICGKALAVAGSNAERLSVADRLELAETSWADGVAGPFGIICSNPPYIISEEIQVLAEEVRGHDPLRALDGGADGLDAYRVIVPAAKNLLTSGGRLYLEIGAGQREAVCEIIGLAGLALNSVKQDIAGHDRIVAATRVP